MKMSVRRIGLASLGKMGCLLGAVAAFLPSLLCGLVGVVAAGLLRQWLASWQEAVIGFDLPFVGEQSLRFDLVEVLRLEGLLTTLETVTSASGLTLAVAVLALALLSGLFLAVTVTLMGLAYNLIASATGGLVVEMKTLGGPDGRQAKAPSEPTGTG